MKPEPYRHITRIDRDASSTHAWKVSLQRHSHTFTKMFSDGVWGGKRAALEAARAWRDQWTLEETEYTHQIWRRNVVRRNNRSGVVGVARYERKPLGTGIRQGGPYWMASWIDEQGTARKRKFSVNKWGEIGARDKALEVRDDQVRKAVAARVTR